MEIAIGTISVLLGMALSYLTFMRGRDKQVRSDATEQAKVSYKLDHIGRVVEDIRINDKDKDRQLVQLSETVVRVDESNKSAHKRIDKLEGKI